MLAPRAHVEKHMCAWCRHTRGFQRVTHHTHHTPHHKPPQQHDHHTTQRQTQRERDIERRGDEREEDERIEERREKREERREKIFFQCGGAWPFCWCSDFPVNSVCARDFSLLKSVKYDSFLDLSALWPVTSFFNICELIFLCSYSFHFFDFFLLMRLQFQIFPNYLFMQLQFFLSEFILHKYSVEG